MKKDPKPYLEDILQSIARIEEYLSEIEQNKISFEANVEKQDAVIRRIELIGEATKRLESGFKDQFPDIPWRKMAGMRDILIHEYDQIDLDLIWKVVVDELPILKRSIREALAKAPS